MLGEDGRIPYNDVGAVERALEKHGKNVAAFLVACRGRARTGQSRWSLPGRSTSR
jgi:hypothetical protein